MNIPNRRPNSMSCCIWFIYVRCCLVYCHLEEATTSTTRIMLDNVISSLFYIHLLYLFFISSHPQDRKELRKGCSVVDPVRLNSSVAAFLSFLILLCFFLLFLFALLILYYYYYYYSFYHYKVYLFSFLFLIVLTVPV